jgi:hypothetical protein
MVDPGKCACRVAMRSTPTSLGAAPQSALMGILPRCSKHGARRKATAEG